MFKRGEISGCDTERAINVDLIIPTSLGFMMDGSVIQSLSVFRLITNIGSCQERPLPIMELLAYILEEEAIKAATWVLTIRQLSLS